MFAPHTTADRLLLSRTRPPTEEGNLQKTTGLNSRSLTPYRV